MTWEETIKYIRSQPEYKLLIENAYFEEDLHLNVERFIISLEFLRTLELLKKYSPDGKTLLDIGSGNGISAVALALKGYKVIAAEPDPSETIGAGAIRKLKAYYRLDNLEVREEFGEEIHSPSEYFDIVYTRQCMHHANNLEKFIGEASRVLKREGILITVRDHVVFNEKDKNWFLKSHPLHRFYGGENAFLPEQYRQAMQNAGLTIQKELRYYDSVINYFPLTEKEKEELPDSMETSLRNSLKKRIGDLARVPFVFDLYKWKVGFSKKDAVDEKRVPGRMYSYIAKKIK
jgi:SAM-dependent methyltransferase